MNILELPATIQLGKMWRRQSTTEMLKREENFKRSGIKTRSTKKPVSALQLYKNCIQNIMIKTGIFQKTQTKNSSKKLKTNCFSFNAESRLFVSCWNESLWKYLLENY